jgi:hypothetical protein
VTNVFWTFSPRIPFTVTDGPPQGGSEGSESSYLAVRANPPADFWGEDFAGTTITAHLAFDEIRSRRFGFWWRYRVEREGTCSMRLIPQPDLPADVSGTWRLEGTVAEATGGCAGEVGDTFSRDITISQVGTDIQVEGFSGQTEPWQGTVDTSTVEFGGSRYEDAGTTTATYTLTSAAESLSGIETWSWIKGNESCYGGVTTISAVRIGP